jgi:hypothetical protein
MKGGFGEITQYKFLQILGETYCGSITLQK